MRGIGKILLADFKVMHSAPKHMTAPLKPMPIWSRRLTRVFSIASRKLQMTKRHPRGAAS